MRIVFMGTPDFAVPVLRVLLDEGYELLAVVTQPDRPKGRKRILTPPPVKVEALQRGIPVLQPTKLREAESVQQIVELKPDLIVTAAYGQILPKAILALPQHGCINVHASLLPKYRGGAPIHYAVMNGEKLTGVTIMYMAEGLDTGDMISKVEVPITDKDTTGTMFHKLSEAGAQLLKRTLPDLLAGQIQAVPQNHQEATYAANISRADERIEWTRQAVQIFDQVRGLNPFPGAFTTWNGEVLKVWACVNPELISSNTDGLSRVKPGTVTLVSDAGMEVMTGKGPLFITQIQPAGKKAMEVEQFLRGTSMPIGTVLGV